MSKFYVLKQQDGGCDYTIGCGISFDELKAKNKKEAIEEVIALPDDWKDYVDDHDYMTDIITDSGLPYADSNNERCLSGIWLLEVTHETDLFSILKKKHAEVEAFIDVEGKKLRLKHQEEAELAQYEALKKKFGKKTKTA